MHHVEERLARLSKDVAQLIKPAGQSGRYVSDEKVAAGLTKVQKALVRFHKQVSAVKYRVQQSLEVKPDGTEKKSTSRACNYNPEPIQVLIPASVSMDLQTAVVSLLEQLEAIGEKLSKAGATLW